MYIDPNNKNKKKLTQKFILVLVIFVMVFANLAVARPAQAQFADIGQAIANAFHIPYNILKKAYEVSNKAYEELGQLGFKKALKRIVGNIAVDTATYIATGDKGQAPMFQTSFYEYIKDEAGAFYGDELNNKIKDITGANLCEPLDPLAKVKLEVQIREYYRSPKPQCTFAKMWKNLGDARKLKLVDLPAVADVFQPTSNDIGKFLLVTNELDRRKRNTIDAAKLELLAQQGYKAVKSLVSGKIKTPWSINMKFLELPIDLEYMQLSDFTGNLTADFIGPFASTLGSKLIKEYKKGLVNDKGKSNSNLSSGSGGAYGPGSDYSVSPVQAAKERFAYLGKPEYNFGGAFDLLNDLSCNNTESQYSCVVDDQFVAALSERPYLTIEQAVKRGLLHGDWPIGYRVDKSGGTDNSQKSIYSYRTLLVLRKYRIIPVGWELAAEYYAKFYNGNSVITLNTLMDDYDDPTSPYYKLVNPGWLLKVPDFICEKEGPGEITADETFLVPTDTNNDGKIDDDDTPIEVFIRKPYCADERSLIAETSEGNYYGYCTQEKSIWKIRSSGGECDALYNSCQSYTARDKSEVAYLTNTLQGSDTCQAEDTGCREYCTDWEVVNDEWVCKTDTLGDRIFLNQYASNNKCNESQAGCTQFIRLATANFIDSNMTQAEAEAILLGVGSNDGDNFPDNDGTFETVVDYDASMTDSFKKAPAYLKCEGYTQETGEDRDNCSGTWRDDIEACVESGSSECNNYSLYCSEADLGCTQYNPISYTGPSIPGVAGEDNLCPQECVGYKTYIEQASFLDPVARNVNLIANTANICSAVDNGCEEFTNLSEGSEGETKEYYSEIRACVLPDNPNVATYYSWESSDKSGNQLRSWTLLFSDLGEYPCTNTIADQNGVVSCTDGVSGNEAYMCTFGNPDPLYNPVYNSDCVEFIADSGASYWMWYSRIVEAGGECVPMRRTYNQGIYSINKADSQQCNPVAAGCREYKGSGANNIDVVLYDDFESGTNDGWVNGANSNEALVANGHSLYSNNATIDKNVTELIKRGSSYKISFWAKVGAGTAVINEIDFVDNATVPAVSSSFDISGGFQLSTNWNRYEASLTNLDRPISSDERLVIEVPSNGLYIDNIQLIETQDDLYLIRDSWNTPISCDQPAEGAMLGCEQYQDSNSNNAYIKSFDKLCREEVLGCELAIDTFNSDSPGSEEYNTQNVNPANIDPEDDVIVPADELLYLVYDPNKACSSIACTAVGLINPQRDGLLTFDTNYLIVEPDDYNRQSSPLCESTKLWCDEFTPTEGGAPEYFKNPNVFTCEYVQGDDGNYGWYQSGSTSLRCPSGGATAVTNELGGSAQCVGGRSTVNGQLDSNICVSNAECTNAANGTQGGVCSGWVGLCPTEQDNCSEYQDPSNPVGCNNLSVKGESDACDFYYYKSNEVETCSEIDPNNGCVGFSKTGGGPNKWYSSSRCSGDVNIACESDADCTDNSGNSLGSCTYLPSA